LWGYVKNLYDFSSVTKIAVFITHCHCHQTISAIKNRPLAHL
jgi:hypothetical protein